MREIDDSSQSLTGPQNDRLRDLVARIIEPDAFARFDADYEKTKGITYEKMGAIVGMRRAREKADAILAFLATLPAEGCDSVAAAQSSRTPTHG